MILDSGLLFDPRFDILQPKILQDGCDYVRVSVLNGRQIVRIPTMMNGKLAYLVGVVIGDGYVSKVARRKTHGAGYYWKIVVTGTREYLINIRGLFREIFAVGGTLTRDKRKRQTWQLKFASLILHRFFTRVIGLEQGRKTDRGSWSRLGLVKEFALYFLAGLIASDGYVGERYIGIIQKHFGFLDRVKRFAAETLSLRFRGPIVNRRLNGKVVGWIISIYRREERIRLLRAIATLDIGGGNGRKWLKHNRQGLGVGP